MSNSEILHRIMALQAIEPRTAEQDEELRRLETEWSNRRCNDYPSKP